MRDWLKGLAPEERRVIGFDLRTVERGFPIGMPLCRPMGNGIYEVRSSLPSKNEARVLFFQDGSELIVVAGFIKKSQKTPASELSLALSRKRSFQIGR
ncbi:MAG: type II toxin-antitoxin system RelE/ParE family toxin [Methylobacterium sp.]|nr:type II toxin-antitoxin system RelE/ParE family toxin [Methylobacterium sp.]